MAKDISINEIYKIKTAAEAEINDTIKGFTLATGMEVEGIKITAIPTKEEKINTYYKVSLEVKL